VPPFAPPAFRQRIHPPLGWDKYLGRLEGRRWPAEVQRLAWPHRGGQVAVGVAVRHGDRLPCPVHPPAIEPQGTGLALVDEAVDVLDVIDVRIEPPGDIVAVLMLHELADHRFRRLIRQAREEPEIEDDCLWALGAHPLDEGKDMVQAYVTDGTVVVLDVGTVVLLRV
jgi:hypothetical protein